MSFAESLIVTLMGTGVVFTGLVLTFLTIVLIVKIPVWLARMKPIEKVAAVPVVTDSAGSQQLPIDSEKMAVIATVLEVELRLRKNVANTRFTFRKR